MTMNKKLLINNNSELINMIIKTMVQLKNNKAVIKKLILSLKAVNIHQIINS